MHVLFFCPSYPTPDHPWQGTFYRTQAQALAEAGHRVGVVAPAPLTVDWIRQGRIGRRGGVVSWMDGSVATVRGHAAAALFGSARRRCEAWRSMGEALCDRYMARHGRPDIVHGHCALTAGCTAVEVGAREKIPSVVTEHSGPFLAGPVSPEVVELARSVFSRAGARLAVSPRLGGVLEELLGDTFRPWQWLPNPVDPCFRPGPGNGNDRDGLVILTVGDLVAHKGTSDLLEAFAGGFAGNTEVVLRVIGDGEERDRLQRLAHRLAVPDQVEWLGRLGPSRVAVQMQNCDLLVTPSHWESLGMVLLEALACGKPVLATACGGPECLVTSHNGLLVPPGRVPEMQQALVRICSDLSAYDPLVIRSDFERRFGTDTFQRSLRGIYHSVMGSRL